MTLKEFYRKSKRLVRREGRSFKKFNRLVVKRKEPKALKILKGNLRRFNNGLNRSRKQFNRSTSSIRNYLEGDAY